MRLPVPLFLLLAAALLAGCASTLPRREVKQAASVVEYLYPKAETAPQLTPGVAVLRPPVRVGLAFVPAGPRAGALPESERLKLLARVKASFASVDAIGAIEIVPTQYLRPGGGFDNLEQVARLFDVEVMALVSHDQVQFNDSNALAVLYWTLVGAYVVHGDEYDVQTMLDVAVFDVASRRLLLRAPGTSQVKGAASLASYSERSRAAQREGYEKAVDQLIPQLQSELARFRERLATDTTYRVESRAGYRGGGPADAALLALLLALAGGTLAARRRG